MQNKEWILKSARVKYQAAYKGRAIRIKHEMKSTQLIELLSHNEAHLKSLPLHELVRGTERYSLNATKGES